MNNWQEILLFPLRDNEARKQFLIACLVTLAGFFIPIVPTLVLLGYSAKIMREIINERKSPAMPDWQGSNLTDMLTDGLRIFGVQIILMLPLFILMGCGFISIMSGSFSLPYLNNEHANSFAPIGIVFFMLGIGAMMLFALLSFPYSVIISAAVPHTIASNSFSAGLNFKEWFPIFRKGLVNFILAYVLIMATSFVLMFIIQFAMMTIILICIVPILMIPYSTYVALVSNVIYAQAYTTGLDTLQLEQHASA